MSVILLIPSALRQFTDGLSEVSVEAKTVGEALSALTKTYEDLQKHLFTESNTLRSYVNVYVNEDDIRQKDGLETEISDKDTVMLLPSIAGGAAFGTEEV